MFTLFESLNDAFNEALEQQTPIFKASVSDPTKPSAYAKALDVQHLPRRDTALMIRRLATKLLSQFKGPFTFEFNTAENGLFNTLTIKATSQKDKSVAIQFEISNLTTQDIEQTKRYFF